MSSTGPTAVHCANARPNAVARPQSRTIDDEATGRGHRSIVGQRFRRAGVHPDVGTDRPKHRAWATITRDDSVDDAEQQPSPASTPDPADVPARRRARPAGRPRPSSAISRPRRRRPRRRPPTGRDAPRPRPHLPGRRRTRRPARADRHARTPSLPDDRYLNRELSWLDFNARVLALAEDASQPLLERAKFLAIFARNLDEFYMVRVAGLKRRDEAGPRRAQRGRPHPARAAGPHLRADAGPGRRAREGVPRRGVPGARQGGHPDQPVVLADRRAAGRRSRPTSPRPCSRC